MKRKKPCVAILADMPRGAIGGKAGGRGANHAATWLPQLADSLAEMDEFEVHWLTLEKGCQKLEVEEWRGQRFYWIPKGKMTLDIVFWHQIARRKLLSLLEKIRPDLVHVWGSESSYPSILRHVKIPSIMSMQGILTHYHGIGGLPGGWKMARQASYEKGWIREATVVTSESEWGLGHVRKICPGVDGRLVEYGVHPSFYDLKWNPDPDRPAVLFCGGIDWRKGVDLLVEALERAGERNWICRIAGEGPLRAELEQRGVKNLEWLGNLRWNELQQQLIKSWALVLPTRADTSPNVVKEARVVGLPVITSSCGGQAGYIRDGQNGWIVDPLDAQNLAGALTEAMGNFEEIKKRGLARWEEDRHYFLPENTAQGFSKIYRELAPGN